MTETDLGERPLCLLVHGFNSSSEAWTPLLALVATDPRNTAFPEFKTFDYLTRLTNYNLRETLPSLDVIADLLASRLGMVPAGRPVILMGHSQGGLVIQRYLDLALRDGGPAAVAQIRSVVLIACPNQGSDRLGFWRRLLPLSNPQELQLRPFDKDVAEMHRRVRRDLVGEPPQRIPFSVFYASDDRTVQPTSAKGSFPHPHAIPGNHSTVIRPPNREADNYRLVVEALLSPSRFSRADLDDPTPGSLEASGQSGNDGPAEENGTPPTESQPPPPAPASTAAHDHPDVSRTLEERLQARRDHADARESAELAKLATDPNSPLLHRIIASFTMQGVLSRRGLRVHLIDPDWNVFVRVIADEDGLRLRIEDSAGQRKFNFDLVWLPDEPALDFLGRLDDTLTTGALRPETFDPTYWLKELNRLLPALKRRRNRAIGLEDFSGAIQACEPQWAIYDWGIGCLTDMYTISINQFDDNTWTEHMSEKVWVDMQSFRQALSTARALLRSGMLNPPEN